MPTADRPSLTSAPSVVISNVCPVLEGGRFPVKRISGEPLRVDADIFKDGHDAIFALLKWRQAGETAWQSTPMSPSDNDRWSGQFTTGEPGYCEYTIEAWPDTFRTWKLDLKKRLEAGQPDLKLELIEGAEIMEAAAERATAAGDAESATQLSRCAEMMLDLPPENLTELLFSADLQTIVDYWPDRRLATVFSPVMRASIERPRARFSAWYEFFPRSAMGKGEPSALRDTVPRLDDAAAMGFDVVYLPPVHPIGETARKGKNNSATCAPDEPGSPWAIGNKHGGHYSINPALGTMEDFDWFLAEARGRGLEVALDFAINCSPDHPYVTQHPDWFHHRPDGTIKYAENPPKKYQDIYPLNFHCADWKALWQEMRDIVLFWTGRGVRIFRVDNPHTKPVAFWEYLISDVRRTHPDVLFLAEAFTRPKMMQMLAKIGFQQSYTYFTWRVSKAELAGYAAELTRSEMREYFIGNFWPNTPDILAFQLHGAPPSMFKLRAGLAATLSSSWGMYSGYEFCENTPLDNGKEEYLDSEKYQVSERDWDEPGIKAFIATLNRARRENPALHEYANLIMVESLNDHVLAYAKTTADRSNRIMVVANLEPELVHESTVRVPLEELGLAPDVPFAIEDLLTGATYEWRGSENYVRLPAGRQPMHLFRIL